MSATNLKELAQAALNHGAAIGEEEWYSANENISIFGPSPDLAFISAVSPASILELTEDYERVDAAAKLYGEALQRIGNVIGLLDGDDLTVTALPRVRQMVAELASRPAVVSEGQVVADAVPTEAQRYVSGEVGQKLAASISAPAAPTAAQAPDLHGAIKNLQCSSQSHSYYKAGFAYARDASADLVQQWKATQPKAAPEVAGSNYEISDNSETWNECAKQVRTELKANMPKAAPVAEAPQQDDSEARQHILCVHRYLMDRGERPMAEALLASVYKVNGAPPSTSVSAEGLSDAQIAAAVMSYAQAGKRGCDLYGAMKCAVDAAIAAADKGTTS